MKSSTYASENFSKQYPDQVLDVEVEVGAYRTEVPKFQAKNSESKLRLKSPKFFEEVPNQNFGAEVLAVKFQTPRIPKTPMARCKHNASTA